MAKLKPIERHKAIEGKVYRIGHNTTQWLHDNVRYTQLYTTIIAKEYLTGGRVAIAAGSHHTKTTQDRLNQVLMLHGFAVGSYRGTWHVRRKRDDMTVEFFDGMMMPDVFDIFS